MQNNFHSTFVSSVIRKHKSRNLDVHVFKNCSSLTCICYRLFALSRYFQHLLVIISASLERNIVFPDLHFCLLSTSDCSFWGEKFEKSFVIDSDIEAVSLLIESQMFARLWVGNKKQSWRLWLLAVRGLCVFCLWLICWHCLWGQVLIPSYL